MAKKKQTRGDRWIDAAERAVAALEELKELQSEYEGWRDNVPESLQSGATYEKLDTICDLDIEGAFDTCSDAVSMEMPLGFGRD